MATAGNGLYTFSSRPRAVEPRPRDREPAARPQTQRTYGNIMSDRRVVRGNTYSRHVMPAAAQPRPTEAGGQPAPRPRAGPRRAAGETFKPATPEAPQGRKHMHMQTELYLEELTDAVAAADVECQTDAFLDKPASPLFIPAKTGKDVATQIEEGELFDFDLEVQPVLEVLVGKTVEQSLLEVMEEEELARLRAQQRAFEELHNHHLAKVQQLRERERRHRQEKDSRIVQQKEVLRKEKETAEKMAAQIYTQHYLASLVPATFSSLRGHGFFNDPVERDIETTFFPWLMAEVNKTLKKRSTAREMVDITIGDVFEKRLEAFRELDTEPPGPHSTI